VVVGIVALPLSMALAIATGMPPQNGIYTAIVAGAVVGALGGSRVQVSGPTAAFVAVLLPISAKYGPGGLMLATFMAGALLLTMGLARLGRLIQFVPYPVVTGFTAGIGLVIAAGQLKDFFGLQGVGRHAHFHETVPDLIGHLDTLSWSDSAVGISTLILLIWLPRIIQRVPAPLLAIGGVAFVGSLVHGLVPEFDFATIADRFSYEVDGVTVPGIPPTLPSLSLPWEVLGPGGELRSVDWTIVRELMPSALVIALLGAIESLLSAVASDAMSGHKHDPNAELMAQGVGNLAAPLLGGFAATGAIARTATNVRAGAVSPVAAITHAGFLLVAVLVLAPLLDELPLASMAALLLVVAWRMADVRHFRQVLKWAPASDTLVLLCCFALTVLFDMAVGVTAGVMLASLLFMRRMTEMTGAHLVRDDHPDLSVERPPGVMVYEIDGPLYFGAAEKAMSALHSIQREARALVLSLDGVRVVDATGLVNLRSVLDRMRRSGIPVILTGVHPRVVPSLQRAELVDDDRGLFLREDLDAGIALAVEILAGDAGREPAPQATDPTGL